MAQLDSICRICMQQDLLLKTVHPEDETMTAIYDIIFKRASVQVCGLCEQELCRSYRFFSRCSGTSDELFHAYYKDGAVYIEPQNRDNVDVMSSEFDSEEETFENLDYSCSDNWSTDESKDNVDFGILPSNIDKVNDLERHVENRTNENIENLHVNTGYYNGTEGVPQVDEIDHDLELVKEEPPVFITSKQSDDSSDVIQSVVISLPKIVIPKLKCYPCDLCDKAFIEDSARQRHVYKDHHEAITVASEIDTVDDLTLERNVADNHELESVKEEPPVFITSEQSNDSSDDIQSAAIGQPKIVIPNLKCYPYDLFETFVQDNAGQRHVLKDHHEGITVASKIDTVDDLNLEYDVDDRTVEVPLKLEKPQVNSESYDECDGVLQFDEDVKIDIKDHQLQFVKEEPQTLSTSEQNNDSSDVVQSAVIGLPKVVIRRIKCYPCSLCGKPFVEDSARQQHVRENHHEAIAVSGENLHRNNEKQQNCDRKKLFKCGVCNCKYASIGHLREHLRLHDNPTKMYICDVCGIRIKFRPNFSTHMKVKHSMKTYPCNKCCKNFSSQNFLSKHKKSCTPASKHLSGIYTCDVCGEKIKFRENFITHMKLQHSMKTYDCIKCCQNFTSKDYLSEHKNSCKLASESLLKDPCTGQKPFKCEICNRKYASSSYLRQHLRLHDNPTNMYTCDVCSAKFKFRSNFDTHMKVKHSMKTYTCNKCCQNFSSKKYLSEHRNSCSVASIRVLKKHRTVASKRLLKNQSFKCEICNRKFACRNFLMEHLRLHDNPKRMYTCDVCGEKIKFRPGFFLHMKVKHSMKTYSCIKCCQNFSSKDDLSEHSKSCTLASERFLTNPFKCEICNRKFACRNFLMEHLRLHDNPKRMYTCDVCGEKIKFWPGFFRHMKVKHSMKTYSCIKCCQNFSSKDDLSEHRKSCTLASERFSTNPFKCEICNRKYACRNFLMEHLRLHDNPTMMYTCDVCGTKHKFRRGFVLHMKVKHSMKTYPCDTCCQNFSSKDFLSEHRKSCTLPSKHLSANAANNLQYKNVIQHH